MELSIVENRCSTMCLEHLLKLSPKSRVRVLNSLLRDARAEAKEPEPPDPRQLEITDDTER